MSTKNEELKSAKKWLEILLEEAPDAYFLSNLKGDFLGANKAAEEMIGYTKKELIGKNMLKANILPKDQIPRVIRRLAQHVMGKSIGAEELDLIRKDGKRISIEITGNILRLKGGMLVVGIARNITERKRIEKELKDRNEDLEKFKKIAVGRELEMVKLKEKIKELEKQLKESRS